MFTGALRHMATWPTASFEDVVLPNPKFNEYKDENCPDGIAVYCIHGTADRSSAFSFIANQLINDLPAAISSIVLASFKKRGQGLGIEHFAKQLREKIIKNKHKNVVLMGHSRGGLVAACLAELLIIDDFAIHGIIPVCSPFGGSDFAIKPISWFSTSVDEMQANSLFLKTLTSKIKNSKIKYYYIAGTKDFLVTQNSAHVQDAKEPVVELKETEDEYVSITSVDAYKEPVSVLEEEHLSIMCSEKLAENIRNYLHEIAETFTKKNLNEHLKM